MFVKQQRRYNTARPGCGRGCWAGDDRGKETLSSWIFPCDGFKHAERIMWPEEWWNELMLFLYKVNIVDWCWDWKRSSLALSLSLSFSLFLILSSFSHSFSLSLSCNFLSFPISVLTVVYLCDRSINLSINVIESINQNICFPAHINLSPCLPPHVSKDPSVI